MKLVTAEEMRRLEERCDAAGVSTAQLMENAGLAVANALGALLGSSVANRRVLVLIGPGNNGGDGLVAARHLRRWGARVSLYFCAPRHEPDPHAQSCRALGIPSPTVSEDGDLSQLRDLLRTTEIVLDAVLGTGRARPISEPLAGILTLVRESRARRNELRVVALDLPTGLDCDTGAMDPAGLPADITIALGHPKRGHLSFPGAEVCGRLRVEDIGIPAGLAADLPVDVIAAASVRSALPPRPLGGHKGTFGRVLVVGGSRTYLGAPALAARAAGRAGAGLVTVAAPASVTPAIAPLCPEATHFPLPDQDHPGHIGPLAATDLWGAGEFNAWLLGPGIGRYPATALFLRDLLHSAAGREPAPLVIDADALSLLTEIPSWPTLLPRPVLLTPHPGEMSRLTGLSVAVVQNDRLGVAGRFAREWRATVVLKGAFTVVADPGGAIFVSPFAHPALATAGTGDVLSGLMAGLLAQGMAAFEAARAAVYIHALAGVLAAQDLGNVRAGLLAGDLLDTLPRAQEMVRSGAALPVWA